MFTATAIGNLATDPEPTKSGKGSKFRLAIVQGFGDNAKTTFHNVYVEATDPVLKHVTKGARVMVIGRISMDENEEGGYWPPTFFAYEVKILNFPKERPIPAEAARKAGPAGDSGF